MHPSLPTPPTTPATVQSPPITLLTRPRGHFNTHTAPQTLVAALPLPQTPRAQQTPPSTHPTIQTPPGAAALTTITATHAPSAPAETLDFTNTLFSLPHLRAHHTSHLLSLSTSLSALATITSTLRDSITTGERELALLKSTRGTNTASDDTTEKRLAAAIKNFVVISRKAEKTMAEFEEMRRDVEGCLGVVAVFEEIEKVVGRGEEEKGRMMFWEVCGKGGGLV